MINQRILLRRRSKDGDDCKVDDDGYLACQKSKIGNLKIFKKGRGVFLGI